MKAPGGWAAVGALLGGAITMYFLDPRQGRRRRRAVRDQVVHWNRLMDTSIGRLQVDLHNRMQGTVARSRRMLTPEREVLDERLVARVRSTLGRLASHASAIHVEVENGVVRLSGPVLETEIGDVLTGVRRVRGTRGVESHLRSVRRFGTEAESPLVRAKRGMPPDLLQDNVSPTGRAMLTVGGALLLARGMRQGGLEGTLMATLGGLCVIRAATHGHLSHIPGTTVRDAVMVQKSIEVAVPVHEAFAFWSNFRNFPWFMEHVRSVRETESGISHWVADGPAGIAVSWDAEITALQPHQRIAWRSLEGSTVMHAGEVRFEEVDAQTTRLHVRMLYHPPAGPVGHAVATLFGADPKRQLDEDLARFKTLIESMVPPPPQPREPMPARETPTEMRGVTEVGATTSEVDTAVTEPGMREADSEGG